jgi:hypothetical protein
VLDQSCDLAVVTRRYDDWQRPSAGVTETPFARMSCSTVVHLVRPCQRAAGGGSRRIWC